MIDNSIPQLSLIGLSQILGEDKLLIMSDLEVEEIEELEEEECQTLKK